MREGAGTVFGCVQLDIDAAWVEGWFSLKGGGELYVRVLRLLHCVRRREVCTLAEGEDALPEALEGREGELRAVARQPGILFRAGELVVQVEAYVAPGLKELQVVLKTEEQTLKAWETLDSLENWKKVREERETINKKTDKASEGAEASGNIDEEKKEDDTEEIIEESHVKVGMKKVVRKGGKKIVKVSAKKVKKHSILPAADYVGSFVPAKELQRLVKAASSIAMGFTQKSADGGSASHGVNTDSANATDNQDNADESVKDGDFAEVTKSTFDEILEVELNDEEDDVTQPKRVPEQEESVDKAEDVVDDDGHEDSDEEEDSDDSDAETTFQHVNVGNVPSGNDANPSRKPRRSADFGLFRFALLQGFPPRMIYVLIQDVVSPLPAPLGLFQEHRIRIPRLSDFSCSCSKQCNTHKFRLYLSSTGPGSATLQLFLWYRTWTPFASCNDVTGRFREIFSNTTELPHAVRKSNSQAEDLSYLLVGGFFTQHYPNYFERNIKYLQEKLHFPKVEVVPIHTEGSIERNADVLRSSILKACHGTKSIVLIGHSKGGVDAIAILHMFPDIIKYIYGIIAFQAPFGGTFLIDYVARRSLALNTISNAIKKLLKGDPASFLDMGYEARLAELGVSESGNDDTKGIQSDGNVPSSEKSTNDEVLSEDTKRTQYLNVLRTVPIISFASSSPFDVMKIRSAADVAGVTAMAPAAQIITQYTGFACDGLVTPADARVPHADVVVLDNMLHTEPALYVKGTKYPPGQLTASALVLLFEKAARTAKIR